jgi:hypothetical protein
MKNPEEMTLTEFIEEQHKIINAFENYWADGNFNIPEKFPLTKHPENWDDEFLNFSEGYYQ